MTKEELRQLVALGLPFAVEAGALPTGYFGIEGIPEFLGDTDTVKVVAPDACCTFQYDDVLECVGVDGKWFIRLG